MKGTITNGLEILATGLGPYVETRLRERLGDNWTTAGSVAHVINSVDRTKWDAQVVLVLML